jgi:hypothetical protein
MKKFLKYRWQRVAVYYLIALSTSFLFRLEILKINSNATRGADFLNGWLGALGPFIGGLLMMYVFKLPNRKMSFSGIFKWKSIALIIVPAVVFSFFGVNNDQLNQHLFGFLLGMYIIVYGILEETGWRGYLQDEFKDFSPTLKYFVISCFWYTWHLTFLGNTTLVNELVVFVILWASSIGIGVVADRSLSIIYASCFHIIGNILSFSTEITQYIAMNIRITAIVISLIIWGLAFIKTKDKKIELVSEVVLKK